jgi:glycosyltransferase involved in cell wall biosynthesis
MPLTALPVRLPLEDASLSLPRISVILPAYNRAEQISRAIDSVLAQELGDFELIVVDDGSTDETVQEIKDYRDERVRLIELGENRGSNAARNAGIRASNASLIAFLDSDDFYLPQKLGRVVGEFDKRSGLDVLVDSFVKLTSPGSRRQQLELRNPVTRSTEEFALKLFRHELWKATSAISLRREAAIRAGLFSEDVKQRQDLEFLIRLTEVANCASIDEVLWVKTWAPNRITARQRFIASTLELVRRHRQYYAKPEYRVGLARDLMRGLLLLLREGQFRQAISDYGLSARELGARPMARMAWSGIGELLVREVKRRFRRRRASASNGAEEPAQARSRATERS